MRMPCSACGMIPAVCHMPLKLKGFRCPSHCEVCQPWLQQQGVLPLGTETTLDESLIKAETRSKRSARTF